MNQSIPSSKKKENKQLIRDFVHDIFNRHDFAEVDKYMIGGETFKSYLGGFFSGHPDSHTTITLLRKMTKFLQCSPLSQLISIQETRLS